MKWEEVRLKFIQRVPLKGERLYRHNDGKYEKQVRYIEKMEGCRMLLNGYRIVQTDNMHRDWFDYFQFDSYEWEIGHPKSYKEMYPR